MCMLNEVFGFLNPHALLRSENIEEDINKFKNICTDDANFSELTYEIVRFKKASTIQRHCISKQCHSTGCAVVVDQISFM